MDKVKTRKTDACPIFGAPCDLESKVCLPTKEDMFRCYLFSRKEMQGNSSKQPPEWEVAKRVAQKIESIWKHASLPTVSTKRIIAMILAYHKHYRNIRKPLKSRKSPFILQKWKILRWNLRSYLTYVRVNAVVLNVVSVKEITKCPCWNKHF